MISRRNILLASAALWFLKYPALAFFNHGSSSLPLDGSLINVKNFGAVGDGVTDDTAAILAAIATIPMYSTTHDLITRIVYFPTGTYLISDTIQRIVAGAKVANLVLIGENKLTTSIKLADNATGFTSSGTPKAMIAMHSGNLFGQSPNPAAGEGNEAFNNTIENLTINCGNGNAGAVGVDWVANNIAAIRNVDIKTLGAASCGILMTRRYAGPALISNVTINGAFGVGVDAANPEYSVVLEHLTITGATSYGIRNSQNNLNMRDVTITMNGGVGVANIDPAGAGVNTPWGPNEGLLVWLDGTITGTGTAATDTAKGYRNWKNVNVSNFVISGVPTTANLDGVFGPSNIALGGAPWSLAVKDTPLPVDLNSALWVNVKAPLAPTDATAVIQAALNTPGATCIYLPTGSYKITDTLSVPDNIERIEGLFSILQLSWATPRFIFQPNNTRTKDLFVRRLIVENSVNGMLGMLNWNAPAPARGIITDYSGATICHRAATGGELYGENMNGTHAYIDGGSDGVWFRQLNPEVTTTKVANINAPLWILGLKTEQKSTTLSNDGGNVEVLGGLHFPGGTGTVATPFFTNINSGRIAAAYVEDELASGQGWVNELTSTINGVANTITTAAQIQRGAFNGRLIPKLCTDDFVPTILFTPNSVFAAAAVGTVVGTATLSTDFAFSGTPVWALSNNASGKYAIDSSTGVVTVAAALSAGTDAIIIAPPTGITLGNSGAGTIAAKPSNIVVSATWDPSFLSPELWAEAASSSLFQSNAGSGTPASVNGDVIGFVGDKSLKVNNLISVADDTTRPTLQGVGTHPVIRFDGVNDLLRRLAALGLWSNGSATVAIALKSNTPGVSAALFSESSGSNNPFYIPARVDSATATKSSSSIRNDAGTTLISGTSTPGLAAVYGNTDIVLIITDSGSVVSHYIDQGSAATASYTRSGTLTLTKTVLGGLDRATPGNFWKGDIYGLVAVKGVISSSDRALLATYMAALQGRSI